MVGGMVERMVGRMVGGVGSERGGREQEESMAIFRIRSCGCSCLSFPLFT